MEFSKKLDISGENILFEPEGKNTLAPIGVLTHKIYDRDKKAIVLVLPSDHYIKNESKFMKILTQAISAAKKGLIVTLGIVPDKPETGYGYIKINQKSLPAGQAGKIQNLKIYKVDKFIEKPTLSKAEKFIKDRQYFWNSGMFVFRADTMLQEIKKFSSHNYGIINKIKDTKSLKQLWKRFSSLSIYYAIMEKTQKMGLIPADFGWSDLGSWQAVDSLFKKDKNGNIFKGNCIDVGSKDILAWSSGRILATIGLNNIIVVETKDALLVCAKDKAQEVKAIVRRIP
jgi:mannose-1-phosphate guanylyltransferase